MLLSNHTFCSHVPCHRHQTSRLRAGRARTAVVVVAAVDSSSRYRLRQARVDDAAAVSRVTAEVFGSGNFSGSGVEDSAFIQELEAAYTAAVTREGDTKLAAALMNKEQAALAARAYRLRREAAMLRAQLAMARNQPAVFPTEGPNEFRQLAKWRRSRKFVCLLIEEVPQDGCESPTSSATYSSGSNSSSFSSGYDDYDDLIVGGSSSRSSSGGLVVATATISLMQAEAALPPPFPSNAPLRAYISNMAVLPSARRQGLAKTLCAACGRIAKAWGEPCVLLHVAADNTSAQQLYQGCGFAPVSNSQGLTGIIKGPWTQLRMVVAAAELAGRYQCLSSTHSSSTGAQVVMGAAGVGGSSNSC